MRSPGDSPALLGPRNDRPISLSHALRQRENGLDRG